MTVWLTKLKQLVSPKMHLEWHLQNMKKRKCEICFPLLFPDWKVKIPISTKSTLGLYFSTPRQSMTGQPTLEYHQRISPLWSINRGSDLVQFLVSKSSSEFCGQLKLDCWKTTNIIIASCNYSGLQFNQTRHYKLIKYPMNWTISYVYLRSFIST